MPEGSKTIQEWLFKEPLEEIDKLIQETKPPLWNKLTFWCIPNDMCHLCLNKRAHPQLVLNQWPLALRDGKVVSALLNSISYLINASIEAYGRGPGRPRLQAGQNYNRELLLPIRTSIGVRKIVQNFIEVTKDCTPDKAQEESLAKLRSAYIAKL